VRPFEDRIPADANPVTAVRQYPLVVVLFAVLFGLLGVAFAINQPSSFSARAGIVVEDARAKTILSSGSSDAERYVADQVAILESPVVAELASELAAASDPPVDISVEDFLSNTSIASSGESNFITIIFGAPTAQQAQTGANAIGLAYAQIIQDALAEDAETAVAELDTAISDAVLEIEALQSQIEALRTDNDERVELDNQLAEIIAGLVDIRRESALLTSASAGDVEARAELNVRLQQLTEELRGRLLVSEVEEQVPATAFLLRQQDDAAARLSELTLRRSQIEVESQLAGNGVAFLSPAGTGNPRGVPTSSTAVMMAALGGLIGAGFAYWLSQRRRYVETRLAPQSILEAPLLAEVPQLSSKGSRRSAERDGLGLEDAALLPIINDPASAQAEAFRVLVGALTQRLEATRAHDPSDSPRGMTIAVCSSDIGEGKTVVATNTALAASRAGLKVALVDGDFGSQDASRLLATSPRDLGAPGLTDVVRGETRLDDAITQVDAGGGGFVGLIGKGRRDVVAPDLFNSSATGSVLAELADQHDLILLDLPPLLHVAYAAAAVRRADQALVVVRHRSPIDSLHELHYRLDVIGVQALGYVYTNAPTRRGRLASRGASGDVLGQGNRP
jgi:Mrp family chromosome partitioning ATPase/uncharacterized protein involved in exopolysaccharide biosynthesis